MSFCLLQTSQELGSHFDDFEQVEKVSSYFTDFERAGHGCFLDTLLNPSYPCLSVKIFSFLFIHYGCIYILTDQLELGKNKNTESMFNIFNVVTLFI